MIAKSILETKKTGRYYTLGKANPNVYSLWIVFHGYGQLANEFIENFSFLESENTLIIAPEALNKFYLRGFNGKIGAAWMTKEDRENEIKDYVCFIDKVFNEATKKLIMEKCKINVLGFSQGTHTAVRWLDSFHRSIDKLILWSGSFPRDCDYNSNMNYWKSIETTLVIGENDKMITESMVKDNVEYFQKMNLNIKLVEFNGGHEIDEQTLTQL